MENNWIQTITFHIEALNFNELLLLKIVISTLCKQRHVEYSLLKINKNYSCTIIYSLNQLMKPLLIYLVFVLDATTHLLCEMRKFLQCSLRGRQGDFCNSHLSSHRSFMFFTASLSSTIS